MPDRHFMKNKNAGSGAAPDTICIISPIVMKNKAAINDAMILD